MSSMSATTSTTNPYLLAILLVAQGRTGSGAEIVFHYPPEPLSIQQTVEDADGVDGGDGDSSSSDSDESSSGDDFDLFTKRFRSELTRSQDTDGSSQYTETEHGNDSGKKLTQDDEHWKPSWEPLLGLGEDGLMSLLAPGRAWHKRKFELGINDFTFLGRPVYAREDGFWRKPKSKKKLTVEPLSSDAAAKAGSDADGISEDEESELDGKEDKPSHTKDTQKNPLTMFHVVFVMDPPPLECAAKVREMYDHVVKKVSKVMKWAQSRQNYVWEEVELLQSIKSTHLQQHSSSKTLYTELLHRSSLAAAMAKVFENISAGKIAAVTLGAKLSVSLQIPPLTSSSYLPSLSEPPLQPGLWLTTSTDSSSASSDLDATSSTSAMQLSKNYTLLLKANPQKILKDIQTAGGPLAMPLSNFVQHLKPTKSFYKISMASQVSLGDIQHLARHLVYWRRATAIPPLHQRDTFIVSPNADMNKLVPACKAYDATFPMMPSLAKMLGALSGPPAPYGTLIPSKDHKEEYYKVLAWLMREGWVTQLRTFALVRVGPEMKKAVRDKDREDNRGYKTPVERDGNDRDLARSFGSGTATTTPNGAMSSFKQRPSMLSRPSSDGRGSISTEATSMRGATHFQHDPKSASLVLSPQRAAPIESRWLDFIGSTLGSATTSSGSDLSVSPGSLSSDHERTELQQYWPLFVKYFTGLEALERIPIIENIKRKTAWEMLAKIGLDLEGPVENEQGDNKTVLVAIRHW